jgi:hypothetical protein
MATDDEGACSPDREGKADGATEPKGPAGAIPGRRQSSAADDRAPDPFLREMLALATRPYSWDRPRTAAVTPPTRRRDRRQERLEHAERDAVAALVSGLQRRRLDLLLLQATELGGAALARVRERLGLGVDAIPPSAALESWIDAVAPPPGVANGSLDADITIPAAELDALVAAPPRAPLRRELLALGAARPDLSEPQRYELFRAGLRFLIRREAGFIISPSQGVIFTWIDQVVPVRSAGSGAATSRRAKEGRLPRKPRRRGRPPGGKLTADLIRLTFADARKRFGRSPTQVELAPRLRVSLRTLQEYLAAHEIEWPPE